VFPIHGFKKQIAITVVAGRSLQKKAISSFEISKREYRHTGILALTLSYHL
jgi:hypothetical protein